MVREATCHCGQLAVRCKGEPAKVSLCHCLDCQRRTGSLFSIAAFYSKENVDPIRGTAKSYRRSSASGFDVTFYFCGECGSNLWWEPDRLPSLIGIAVGAFAEPDFPVPTQAVWAEHRHRWLELPDDIISYARNPVRPDTSQ